MHSLSSLDENPADPKTEISGESLEELIAFVKSMGISSVAFTAVPRQWVFKGKAVLHDHAIVLTMEMDKERIDTAPSLDAQMTVMETYRDLGVVTNKAAGFLRQRGFSAHAGHPLNGLALYPPLAQMAGLGWLGASGLIIGPEHGPRFRLSAVFTSITNLPPAQENSHAWIGDYCAHCGLCAAKCPVGAIYPEPITRDSGQITYVDEEKCFPYFSDFYGCSVCISVCPFNHVPYSTLKAGVDAVSTD
jgi:epoxyqueuosine reductase